MPHSLESSLPVAENPGFKRYFKTAIFAFDAIISDRSILSFMPRLLVNFILQL
jgi:hypothetical protein